MTDRAKECARCRFWCVDFLKREGCVKGHHPHYYLFAYTGGKRTPGYRRHCEDFEEAGDATD